MSRYRISLEGKTYEIEIELVGERIAQQPTARQEHKQEYKELISSPKDTDIRVADSTKQKQILNNRGIVVAPMPGTVFQIEKKIGDTVKAGELVLILEAMKMENEILAPADGTITIMNCTEGKTVSGGDILFEVK